MILFMLKSPVSIMMTSMMIDCLFHDLFNVLRNDSIEDDDGSQFKFPLFSEFASESTSITLHINEFSNSDFTSMHELNNHDHNVTKYNDKEMNELDKFLEKMDRELYEIEIRKMAVEYQDKILKELDSCRWDSNNNDVRYELLVLRQKYIFPFDDEDVDWKEMIFIIESLNQEMNESVIIEEKVKIKERILEELNRYLQNAYRIEEGERLYDLHEKFDSSELESYYFLHP